MNHLKEKDDGDMSDVKNFYNNNARKLLREEFNKAKSKRTKIQKLFKLIKKENYKVSVIEIGYGNGRDSKEILKYTKNYKGIDLSSEMQIIARSRLGNEVILLTEDVRKYEFASGIDLVYAYESLIFLNKEEMSEVLERIYKALNPNGIVFIALKYGEYSKKIIVDKTGRRCFYLYTPQLVSKLAREGYKKIYSSKIRTQKSEDEFFDIILRK